MTDKNQNWLTQKTGEINHHNDSQIGTQPTKVLHNILKWMFYYQSDSFSKEIYDLIVGGGIQQEIEIEIGEEPIIQKGKSLTPFVDSSKKLKLHQSFLSYVWCISYSLYVLYNEEVSYAQINRDVGYEKYKRNPDEVKKAYDVLIYGIKLIKNYEKWDKEKLPNPEKYLAENRDYVEQSNTIFTEAIKWILVHEYTHIRDHIDEFKEGYVTNSHIFQFEEEADDNATKTLLKGIKNESHKLIVESGIVVAILCLFYFKKETTAIVHPDTEDRLTAALEIINPHEYNHIWGLACVGIQLWDQTYSIGLDYDKKVESHKELYYDIIKQLKEKK